MTDQNPTGLVVSLAGLASKLISFLEAILPGVLIAWNGQLRRERDAARAREIISTAQKEAALVEVKIKTDPTLPTGRRALLERNLRRLRELAKEDAGPGSDDPK